VLSADARNALFFAIPLPFMMTLVSPLSFYLANHTEYSVAISALLPVLLLCFLGMAGFLFVLLVVGKKRPWNKVLKGLLVALGVSAWVQSQLLAWNFGPLDGRGILWRAWIYHACFEILLWGGIIVSVGYLTFRKEKIFHAVTQGMILLGVLTLASSWLTSDYRPKMEAVRKETSRGVESSFIFHPAKNKMIIVLDTFQSDIFGEIAQRWPEEVSFLQGFTFYPNTLGGFSSTGAACPLILTGRYYKNEISILDWIEKNNAEFNIADYLAAKGYDTALVSFAGQTLAGIRSPKFHLASLGEPGVSGWLRPALLVLDGGVFRTLPIVLKKSFYDEGNWFFVQFLDVTAKVPPNLHGDDLRFIREFERKAAVSSGRDSVFRYYHLFGSHMPVQVNEKFEYVKNMPEIRESYVQQSRGVLSLLKRLLQRLKDFKVYETAEIVVAGDHGSMLYPPNDFLNDRNGDEGPRNSILASSRPLFLYKPAAGKNVLSSSDAPMHLEDIVCILSGNQAPPCSDRTSSRDQTNQRKRFFYGYDYTSIYWSGAKKYMPPMTQYVVEGDVRDLSAWRNTNVEFIAGTSRHLPIELDEIIDFSAAGNSNYYIQRGWSVQEPEHRFTEGARAVIRAELKKNPRKDLTLRLNAEAFPANGKGPQTVGVEVNDKKIAQWRMLGLDWYEATIPVDLVTDRLLKIVFDIRNPTAPCEIGASRDCRKLGIAARKLTVAEKKVVRE